MRRCLNDAIHYPLLLVNSARRRRMMGSVSFAEMASIPGNTGWNLTMLREYDRFFQHFTGFHVDRLLDSDDASSVTSVTFGLLDSRVADLKSICRPCKAGWATVRKVMEIQGLWCSLRARRLSLRRKPFPVLVLVAALSDVGIALKRLPRPVT